MNKTKIKVVQKCELNTDCSGPSDSFPTSLMATFLTGTLYSRDVLTWQNFECYDNDKMECFDNDFGQHHFDTESNLEGC